MTYDDALTGNVTATSGALPLLHRYWFRVCWIGMLLLGGARLLHYAPLPLPDALDALLDTVIQFEIGLLRREAEMFFPTSLLILAIVVLLIVRHRWLLIRGDGRLGTRPWLHSLIWAELLFFSLALDMDPRTTLLCLSSAPLLLDGFWKQLYRHLGLPRIAVRALVWAGLFALWAALATDPNDVKATLLWAVLILPIVVLALNKLWLRDRLWLALMCVVAVQAGAALMPQTSATHGGTPLSNDGYAFSFCEVPERNKLFVAVPCDRGRIDVCGMGYVAEHDSRDLTKRIEHRFFSDDFHGRLVHLACLGETVQVGMALAMVGGNFYGENVMEFSVDDPTRFRTSLYGRYVGHRVAYDRRHDAVFYSSEWNRHIFRYDRATGTLNRRVADAMYESAGTFGSHMLENNGFHEGRDSIFIAQWLGGSTVFELNRTSLELMAEYHPFNGGNLGLAVDDELDRLWVSGVWGVDVLEIGSGRLLKKRWLGLGTRLPVIDRVHDIVYITTTAGRLWALDRRTLEVLGNLAVGGGSRNPYVSHDASLVFACNDHGYFYWDAAELARRFRDW